MGYFGCWEWDRGCTSAGYGIWRVDKQPRYVHRIAYAELVGPIPEGHLLHHTCCNRGCYNPDHLELATNATHVDNAPGKERAKTHCKYGHPFDAENTYFTKEGWRRCRTCHREWERKQQEKRCMLPTTA